MYMFVTFSFFQEEFVPIMKMDQEQSSRITIRVARHARLSINQINLFIVSFNISYFIFERKCTSRTSYFGMVRKQVIKIILFIFKMCPYVDPQCHIRLILKKNYSCTTYIKVDYHIHSFVRQYMQLQCCYLKS